MDRVFAVCGVVLGLMLTAATALLGFTIPGIWTLQSDVGGIKATLVSMDKRLESIEKKLEGLDGKADAVGKRAGGIDARLAQKESDPSTLLALAGWRPATEFTGVSFNGKLYALRRSDQAQTELASAGLKREPLTPTIAGYLLGTYNQSGLLTFEAPDAAHTASPGQNTRP